MVAAKTGDHPDSLRAEALAKRVDCRVATEDWRALQARAGLGARVVRSRSLFCTASRAPVSASACSCTEGSGSDGDGAASVGRRLAVHVRREGARRASRQFRSSHQLTDPIAAGIAGAPAVLRQRAESTRMRDITAVGAIGTSSTFATPRSQLFDIPQPDGMAERVGQRVERRWRSASRVARVSMPQAMPTGVADGAFDGVAVDIHGPGSRAADVRNALWGW